MKGMKKIVALILSVAMILGLMTVSVGAAAGDSASTPIQATLTPYLSGMNHCLTFYVDPFCPAASLVDGTLVEVDETSVYTYNGQPSQMAPFTNVYGLYMELAQMSGTSGKTAAVGDTIEFGGTWQYTRDNKYYQFDTVTYEWKGSKWEKKVPAEPPTDVTLTPYVNYNATVTFNVDQISNPQTGEPTFEKVSADAAFTYNGVASAGALRMTRDFGLFLNVAEMTGGAQSVAASGDKIVLSGVWKYAGDEKQYNFGTVEYVWSGSQWAVPLDENIQEELIDTDIAKIQLRDTSSKFLIYPTVHDYEPANATTVINNMDTEYNTLDSIVLYKGESEYSTLADLMSLTGATGERYYNIWGNDTVGSFSIDLPDGWDGTTITKIVFKQGCQFPSYRTTNAGAEKKYIYQLTEDMTYTTKTSYMDNVDWSRTYESTAKATSVTNVKLMGAKGDLRLILFLDANDYKNADESFALSNKFEDYNTFENIILWKGNKKISLADAMTGEEVYYNLWGNQGTISYGLQEKYHETSFDKVEVLAGCEFPSYSYTATDAKGKVAYTTSVKKSLKVKENLFAVKYYDQNNKLLYTDKVACRTAFDLRDVPKKSGYVGSWEGLAYTVMPAQDIKYYLTYEKQE